METPIKNIIKGSRQFTYLFKHYYDKIENICLKYFTLNIYESVHIFWAKRNLYVNHSCRQINIQQRNMQRIVDTAFIKYIFQATYSNITRTLLEIVPRVRGRTYIRDCSKLFN